MLCRWLPVHCPHFHVLSGQTCAYIPPVPKPADASLLSQSASVDPAGSSLPSPAAPHHDPAWGALLFSLMNLLLPSFPWLPEAAGINLYQGSLRRGAALFLVIGHHWIKSLTWPTVWVWFLFPQSPPTKNS